MMHPCQQAGSRDGDEGEMMIVFAFGSNLCVGQMRARCPSAKPGPRAILHDHALLFAGFSAGWDGAVATVVRRPGARVPGLIYAVDREDVRRLDRFEGCPFAYERVVRVVTDEHARRRRVQLYTQPEDGLVPWLPSPAYLRVILGGYRRWGFDRAPLAAAIGGLA